MHRGCRAVLVPVAAVVLATVLLSQGAGAQQAPTLTVTPNTGLEDGQRVSLAGTGYAGVFAIGALECPPQFAGRTEFTINEVLTNCGFLALAGALSPDTAGDVTGSAPVQEVFTPSSSTPTSYDCTIRNDCLLLVAGLAGSGLRGATAPIRFGPATPSRKSDCTHGGWRDVVNDGGQPFRSQGQCVRFVQAHRR